MKILKIDLRIIQDSKGRDTLEAEMTSNDLSAISSVPAGVSKGKFEMFSVASAIALQKFEEIKNEILNTDFPGVSEFDNFLIKLDGTPDKSNLGGNLILVLSVAFTKLFAKSNNLQTYELIGQMLGKVPQKFPYLYFNLIGGGLHAADSLPFQEYLLVTKSGSPVKDLRYAELMVEKLKLDITKNFGDIRYGDEGEFAIKGSDPRIGLEVLKRNLDGKNISLALDVAASTFYLNGEYKIGENIFNTQPMLELYQDLASEYSLLSIEDPFSEDDKEGFAKIYQILKDKVWIVGDDLTVTNKDLIQKAIDGKQITGVIIKPNQIGSVSETLDAIRLAMANNLKIIVSHRGGETNDDFIADLAFGAQADGLKSGSPTQPQRMVKYNRLIEIETRLNLL
ncbi:MAG: Enolase [Candidatus Levybacteria bacterium]|nr:Enolase [Candidatus Levybacteria bacterium]